MMLKWGRVFGAVALLGAGLLFSVTGCSDDDDEDSPAPNTNSTQFAVSPSAATLGTNQTTVILTAEDGMAPYIWSVSDSSLGTVAPGNGASATYTRNGSAEGINVITVTEGHNWRAQAQIVQDNTP